MDVQKKSLFFVSEKVSKVRWMQNGQSDPDTFLTGSWGCSKSNIKFWRVTNVQYTEDEVECVPECIEKISMQGDITALECLNNNDGYVAATSLGSVVVINTKKIPSKTTNIHKNGDPPVSCTCLSVFDNLVVSAWEDGKLSLFSTRRLEASKTYENADSCAITALSFINIKNVLAGSHNGAVKIFDMSSDSKKPVASFIASYDSEKLSNGITSFCSYPTQEHIVLVGDEDGAITVWDLRNVQFPQSCISAHPQAITELQFHKMDPTKLFTASENGELLQWSQNFAHPSMQLNQTNSRYVSVESDNNPWLSEEGIKSRISATCILSETGKAINSFDVYGSKIVCGGDAESICILENIS